MYFLVERIETTIVKRVYVVNADSESLAEIKASVGPLSHVENKEGISVLQDKCDTEELLKINIQDCRDKDIWTPL